MGTQREHTNIKSKSAPDRRESKTASSGAPLRDYEAAKFRLARLIRGADSDAWRQKNDVLQREFRQVLKRLAEDRFYVTLAGQFNRGKTTLLNAMLGMDRLPMGIVPITSVITAVSYNTHERVMLRFADSNLSQEVSLAELPDWITERGNPGNRRNIEMAEVQLPAEILRRGAFFVDTPGLGSVVLENTQTTRRFLPQVDALVLVTSFEFPLSNEELSFLRSVRLLGRKVFVVVNKQDLCSPAQRHEVLDFIRSRLAEESDWEELPLFTVSASAALTSKETRDEVQLDTSGLPVLEASLVSYLTEYKARDFLVAICDQVQALLESLESGTADRLKLQLEAIRNTVRRAFVPPGEKHERIPVFPGSVSAGRTLSVSSCLICRRMAETTFAFLRREQYDLSSSQERQVLHASRVGFCALHTREYARLASPQGIASGYPSVALFVADSLRNLFSGDHSSEDWENLVNSLLPNERKCSACEVVVAAEENAIGELVGRHTGQERESDEDLPCVCLTHLLGIVKKSPSVEFTGRMVRHAAEMFERLADNMQRFALHHGGLHMELVTEEEYDSSTLCLNLLVGQSNVRPSKSR